MRISNVILAYFVIGMVMFGGGAVDFENAGVANFFVDYNPSTGDASPATGNRSPTGLLPDVGQSITNIAELFSGPLIFIWNLFVGLIAFMNWPLIVMLSQDVPFRVAALLGGAPVVMFYMGILILVKGSA